LLPLLQPLAPSFCEAELASHSELVSPAAPDWVVLSVLGTPNSVVHLSFLEAVDFLLARELISTKTPTRMLLLFVAHTWQASAQADYDAYLDLLAKRNKWVATLPPPSNLSRFMRGPSRVWPSSCVRCMCQFVVPATRELGEVEIETLNNNTRWLIS
jgi:hypothetical protein